MSNNFQRIAIVNRGEAAMRLIRAVRDFNQERGAALRTIALYTDPDERSMFVRQADEAIRLGPAHYVDPRDKTRKSVYLDYKRLESALLSARADAVWVGWGFVAEDAGFAELCEQLGIVFIGPSPTVMRLLGDKISAKGLAREANVRVAPWSGGPVDTLEQAIASAAEIGYPLMLKATAGGGGRGIRRIRTEQDLHDNFDRARDEALKSFGDATVFLERMVEGAHHIEVQIIGDQQGTIWALGLRDCTLQRRNQKLIEESGSPVLDDERAFTIKAAASRLAKQAGYTNAGTVEFLYDPQSEKFSFMEVNARLQVEHPVTEATTGADLVKLQLHVALGRTLEAEPPPAFGYAIEARLNAEDPDNDFMPAPGRIALFRAPAGPGIRVDTGVTTGDRIPADFDSMIAKIVAHGRDRREAMARLSRALSETTVVIDGGTTNKAFLLRLLRRPEVASGEGIHIGWVESVCDQVCHPDRIEYADIAIIQAAIETYESELAIALARFQSSAAKGRPAVRAEVGFTAELGYQAQVYKPTIFRLGRDHYWVEVDGQRLDVRVERFGEHERRLSINRTNFRVASIDQGSHYLVEVESQPHRVSRDDRGAVRAPAPAVVLAINVEPGQQVAVGDRLVVLEAMKMEMPIRATISGVVRSVTVTPNVQVDAGTPLLLIEPSDQGGRRQASERIDFGARGKLRSEITDIRSRLKMNHDELKALLLGFDVNPSEMSRLSAERKAIVGALPANSTGLWESEVELLRIFTDVCSLFRRRTGLDEGENGARSTEEHLFTYLRTLNYRAAGLSASFKDKLGQALAHYGVTSLEHTPPLIESLLFLCKSHQHLDDQAGSIAQVLERWLKQIGQTAGPVDHDLRSILDRLAAVTRHRLPGISDLAREVLHAYFDKPHYEQAVAEIYAQIEDSLAALVHNPSGENRDARMAELVMCPQPLVNLLLKRLPNSSPTQKQLYLEVIARRYYRIRGLEQLRTLQLDGFAAARAAYTHKQKRIQLFSVFSPYSELDRAARALVGPTQDIPQSDNLVLDFFCVQPERESDPDAIAERLRELLQGVGFTRPVRRVVVNIALPGSSIGTANKHHFTFRQQDGVFVEEQPYRGLHPMMGKRLEVWRVRENFSIQRLPSVEDVYLFHGQAHENKKDERLIAFAEVRSMRAVRDREGRMVSVPGLERMLMEGLAAIRHEQSRRSERQRLHWNRLFLYIWPPIDLRPEELNLIVRRLAPATEGLGLEKVVARGRIRNPKTGELRETFLEIANPDGTGASILMREPHNRPLVPMTPYEMKAVRARRRGLTYPYELIKMLTPLEAGAFPRGSFVEYDLDASGEALVAVDRPPGGNSANVIVGILTNYTEKYPEGISRVMICGDPSGALGAIAEPECRILLAALDLAEQKRIPAEWFAVSAGALIAMDTGTENLDWVACVIRKLVEFTQAGHEINVVVPGINVGAQSYWNAEATMLMHTKGILIMTPEGSMVLTGKRALDYSGSVSANDNFGIGGYEHIMGPNGQAQYWARDLNEACRILLAHYDHAYVVPGERFPRRAETSDPITRDISTFPHGDIDGSTFATIGDIFSDANPGRKKPFVIRRVMAAVMDEDHKHIERWHTFQDAETTVVWDVHLGGWPVCMIGIESRPLPRVGFLPADGPDKWTAGTLFPLSSKKVARAINACSNNRPVVVLANLSGFDGSPESMRKLQLEYGAEIGRAVVNFKGPFVFCIISRYHGGAYVVFSNRLNDNVETSALEGSFASVIGGAPAAAVVFAREVKKRTLADERVKVATSDLANASESERPALRRHLRQITAVARSEKLGQVAEEFDNVHTVQRALEVGSLNHIIPSTGLRQYLVEAVERGIARCTAEFEQAAEPA